MERCRKCGYVLEGAGDGKLRCPLCYTIVIVEKVTRKDNLTKMSFGK